MARAKGVTSRQEKRPTEEDLLKKPDEVLTTLQKYSDHVSIHWKHYGFALGGIVALVLGITGIVQWRRSAAIEDSKTFEKALQPLASPVDALRKDEFLLIPPTEEQLKDPKKKPEFATEADRDKAALERLEAIASGSGDLAALAALLQSRAALSQKDAAKAAAAAQKFLEAKKDDPLAAIATENAGRAAEAQGKTDEAHKAYETLANASDLYAKVRGNTLLGDLYNPSMTSVSQKDAGKARGYYEKALELLKPAEGQVFGRELRALRSELKRRADLLQS